VAAVVLYGLLNRCGRISLEFFHPSEPQPKIHVLGLHPVPNELLSWSFKIDNGRKRNFSAVTVDEMIRKLSVATR
jgi:hypothetical protein